MSTLQTYLHRNNGRYYFRCRIPRTLEKKFPRTQVKISLGTACPNRAKVIKAHVEPFVNKMFKECEQMYECSEESYNKYISSLRSIVLSFQDNVDNNIIESSSLEDFLNRNGKILDFRGAGKESRQLIEIIQQLFDCKDIYERLLTKETVDRIEYQSNKLEEDKHLQEKNRELFERILEKGINVSEAPSLIKAPSFSECVEMAIEDSKSNNKTSEHSLDQKRRRMEFFSRVLGDRPISQYSRRDILKYKDKLEQLPNNYGRSPKDKESRNLDEVIGREGPRMTSSTLVKHFREVKSAFQAGAREVDIKLNFLENITVHGRENQKRKIWAVDDLNSLFSTPVWSGRMGKVFRSTYKQGERIFFDEWYWMPVIALFTGMRLEELAKLRVCDFKESNGIPYIEINEDVGRVKTQTSIRSVPIHPKLFKFGLSELLKGPQGSRVFSNLELGGPNKQKFGFDFSKRFTRYRQHTGIYEPLRDFHSFRHTFASELYDKTKDLIITAAVCGHSAEELDDLAELKGVKTQTVEYIHIELKACYEAIKKISYEGVDFSNLLRNGGRI